MGGVSHHSLPRVTTPSRKTEGLVQRLYVTCALGMCSYATDKWVFTTNQPRSLLASRHHAFAKTVDAIATVNTSAEDVFFGYERLLKVHQELLEKAEGVISKLHTLVTSVSYHVARSKPLRMTGSNLIFHKRNERANNHDYGLLLNGSYKINYARETAVTQTLPIACGQSHEHIPSHQKLGDSFLLFRLKRWIPKTSRCLSNVANATPSVSFSSVHVYGGNRGIRNT